MKKNKHTIFIIILVFLIVTISIFILLNFRNIFPGKYQFTHSNINNEDYNYYIEIVKNKKGKNEINFGDVFKFEWDKMYIYSRPNKYDEGFEKDGIENTFGVKDTSWEYVNQIYFIKDNITVYHFSYNQYYLYFDEQSMMINRENAIFIGKNRFFLLTLYQKRD